MSAPSSPVPFWRIVSYAVLGVALVVLVTKGVSALRGRVSETSLMAPNGVAATDSGEAGRVAPGSVQLPDSFYGQSRALRFATLTRARAAGVPGFLRTFGERAIREPAVHRLPIPGGGSFALVVLRPFGEKRGEYLGAYRLGLWPAERWMMAKNYFNPDGFMEVTPENAALPLSEHFTLGEFVTHDQSAVWPKYVVLQEKLIDKLELVTQDLAAHGYDTRRVVVLSGFRAPYYNERGVGEGMARASRHQYGDAADILLDANGDGRMDDLTRDGRLDLRDIAPVAAAVERVERAHPDLVGGLGTYTAMGPSGPFAHVDVRGASARWESGWWKKKPPS